MLITALVFFLILTVLILIHEAGHFFVAKKLGIKVEEFGFGLPPRAFGIKKGETLYSINWLPIGGFVKLYGEDDAGGGRVTAAKDQRPTAKDLHRAFYSRSVWERAGVVVAGVVMNTFLAAVIFYLYFFISGFKAEIPLLDNFRFPFVHQQNVIAVTAVAKNSPAEAIGIRSQSKIIMVNQEGIESISEFVQTINFNKGKEVTITWEDAVTHRVTSAKTTPRVSPPKNEGALGIVFLPVALAQLEYQTLPERVLSGVVHPLGLGVYNFKVMGKLISDSFKARTVAPLGQGVAGPVGIYSLVGIIVQIPDLKERTLQVLNLAGILSISLAFFNILPIPALDGGRFFFILYEGVTGKKVNQKFEGLAHSIGMAVLIALLLLITFKDILQFFK